MEIKFFCQIPKNFVKMGWAIKLCHPQTDTLEGNSSVETGLIR